MAKATCESKVQGSALVVTVLLDQLREAKTAYELRDEMIGQINQAQPRGIVVDLVNVTFIGSIGFLAFLGVRRHLSGGRIVLCNLSDPIREMFSVCRLIATDSNKAAPFETAGTIDEALARLST